MVAWVLVLLSLWLTHTEGLGAEVVDAVKGSSSPFLESRGEDRTRVTHLRLWASWDRREGKLAG
ncbi:hypothetical protein E2562_025283 [Oryza meyeriana var. granulata]|uniref:Uncharacterized protein n=1 Tax=Oryza meyeriana var. granulata TaxID=110450 RepID=A0A6G1BMD7_9ORYZ|nr:hypothetical protein E2562_025283 [Oryza meyeriana var. granulata]